MLVVRTQSQPNQRARIRHALVLPALVRLITSHRLLSRVVPFSRRLAAQVVLARQRFLDVTAALAINRLLPPWFARLLRAMVLGLRILLRGSSFLRRGSKRQRCAQRRYSGPSDRFLQHLPHPKSFQ